DRMRPARVRNRDAADHEQHNHEGRTDSPESRSHKQGPNYNRTPRAASTWRGLRNRLKVRPFWSAVPLERSGIRIVELVGRPASAAANFALTRIRKRCI